MSLADPVTGEIVPDSMMVEDIEVVDRFRRDLGDVDSLAASIRYSGLLHPIVVTVQGRLVAGQRRLEAVRRLGWAEVPVRIAWSVDSARDLLIAERDENTCRKEMAASELYALGKSLEEMERPKADERMRGGVPLDPVIHGEQGRPNKTNDVVGESLGMSSAQWGRLKHLGDRATNGDTDAAAALDEVDRGDVTISRAYRDLREWETTQQKSKRQKLPIEQRIAQIRELAEQGYRASQVAAEIGIGVERVRDLARQGGITLPDATIGKTRALDPNRIVGEAVNALEGVVMGVNLLDLHADLAHLSADQAEEWATSLSTSLKSLQGLVKRLKEMARG